MPAGDAAPVERTILRPIGNPPPLGFLALAGATLVLSGLQLGWVATSMLTSPPGSTSDALGLLLLVAGRGSPCLRSPPSAASWSRSPCVENGGTAVVPAGTPAAVDFTWSDVRRSLVDKFLRLDATTAAVDGVPVADAGDHWSPPTPLKDGWATTWPYAIGVLGQPGDATMVTVDIACRRKAKCCPQPRMPCSAARWRRLPGR